MERKAGLNSCGQSLFRIFSHRLRIKAFVFFFYYWIVPRPFGVKALRPNRNKALHLVLFFKNTFKVQNSSIRLSRPNSIFRDRLISSAVPLDLQCNIRAATIILKLRPQAALEIRFHHSGVFFESTLYQQNLNKNDSPYGQSSSFYRSRSIDLTIKLSFSTNNCINCCFFTNMGMTFSH